MLFVASLTMAVSGNEVKKERRLLVQDNGVAQNWPLHFFSTIIKEKLLSPCYADFFQGQHLSEYYSPLLCILHGIVTVSPTVTFMVFPPGFKKTGGVREGLK